MDKGAMYQLMNQQLEGLADGQDGTVSVQGHGSRKDTGSF